MDQLEALDAATDTLRARLAALSPEQLNRSSNCPGWTVKDLANHVIGGTHRYGLLLQGAHEDHLTATRSHDYVGEDAAAALDEHVGDLRRLFGEPGALERCVAHRAGIVTGAELLGMSVIEQTLHAWDIAVSVHGDTCLDESLCEYVLDLWTGSIDRLRELGFYGASTAVSEGSSQSRLLAYAGR